MIQIANTECPQCGNPEADSYEDGWPTHYYEISCESCGYFHAMETYPPREHALAEQLERVKIDVQRVLDHVAGSEDKVQHIQTTIQKAANGLSYNMAVFYDTPQAAEGSTDEPAID
jgi:uncharacterized Zn finger protein (UPF0148 family)